MHLRIQSWHGDQELIRLRKKMSSFGLCTAGQDNGLIYNADTKLAYSVILGCVGGDLHAEKFHVRYIAMWVHPAVVASRIFWQQLKLFSWEIWSTPPILRILPKKKSSHGDQQFAEIHMNMV